MAQPSTRATAPESRPFEEQVSEYIRKYPYQQTYDYAVRYTRGSPALLNIWVFKGEPALVRAGDDIVPRTSNDTYYQAATLWLEDGPVVLSSGAASEGRFNSFQLIDERNVNYRNIIYPKGEYTLYFGEEPQRIFGTREKLPAFARQG